MAEVITIKEAITLRQRLREQKKTIVTTNGSFDIIHPAHINLLAKAKSFGDVLLVLVNSDISIKVNKDPKRPILPEKDRMYILANLVPVDYVAKFDEKEVAALLKEIKPDFHVKGGSFIPERIEKEKEAVERNGGRHICLPLEEGYSTTKIIEEVIRKYANS